MAVVAKLVGKETREYKGQDRKQHVFCGLHLVHLEDMAALVFVGIIKAIRR